MTLYILGKDPFSDNDWQLVQVQPLSDADISQQIEH